MDGVAGDEDFLEGDREWMVSADVAFVVPNISGLRKWEDSAGSLQEIDECRVLNIPVIYLEYIKEKGGIAIPEEWNHGEKEMDFDSGDVCGGDAAARMRVMGDHSDVQFRYDPDSANNPPPESNGVPARILRICEKWDERGNDPGIAG